MTRRLLGSLVVAVLVLVTSASASARSLYWRSMKVRARLDADGRLHVSERLDMVFDGDWNGGERRFQLAPGQTLELGSVERLDPSSGAERPLARGDLAKVDQFALVAPDLLRWRSRSPSDPVFSHQDLVYTIDYVLSGILKRSGSAYRLDHDFSFPDRDGVIEALTVDLTLDPVWRPQGSLPGHFEAGPLPPGRGYVVTADLLYTGAGAPAAIQKTPLELERVLAALVVVLGILLFGGRYLRSEGRRGRFAPFTPSSAIDRAWLEKNLFRLLPEEAGAAFADEVGAASVAALLARLVAEGKLASETISGLRPTLRLQLKVPRADLHGYERLLIDQLFFADCTTVTPEELRAHYRSTGFDPAKIIRDRLQARLDAEAGFSDHLPRPPWRRTKILAATSALLGVAALVAGQPVDWDDTKVFLIIGFFCGTVGLFLASAASETFRPFSARLLGTLALCLAPLAFVIAALPATYSLLFLSAASLFTLGLVSAAFRLAVSPDGPLRMDSRRRIAAARQFLDEELRRPKPRLEDAWYPYLIALGLGPRVASWVRGFGGSAGAALVGSAASAASATSGWSGGGGRFGGGGASASWASAVGGFSAGVSSPSSGGGSSGGGGGGGW